MPVVCHYFVAAMACWLFGPAQAADGPEAPLRLVNLSPLDAPNMVAMRKTLDVAFARAGMRYTYAICLPSVRWRHSSPASLTAIPIVGRSFSCSFPMLSASSPICARPGISPSALRPRSDLRPGKI